MIRQIFDMSAAPRALFDRPVAMGIGCLKSVPRPVGTR